MQHNPDEDWEPLSSPPGVEVAQYNALLLIHVCQAAYGDTIALDIDPSPPTTNSETDRLASKSRHVILIDGGPATWHGTGRQEQQQLPILNLYNMLSNLLPIDAKKLDTLVVTHDDTDHMLGISELLLRLNQNTPSDLWSQGTTATSKELAPFANIWHNSAETMVDNFDLKRMRVAYAEKQQENDEKKKKKKKQRERSPSRNGKSGPKGDRSRSPRARKKSTAAGKKKSKDRSRSNEKSSDEYKPKRSASGLEDFNAHKGYFDEALKKMRVATKDALPYFNQEFAQTHTSKEWKDLVMADANTSRGHVEFEFLGPGKNEIRILAKYFEQHHSTRGLAKAMKPDLISGDFKSEEAKAKKLASLVKFEKKYLINDISKKNLSSIVFLAKIPSDSPHNPKWRGLFTGDASALTLFRAESNISRSPLTLDLMKVGHHGSCFNNFLDTAFIESLAKVKGIWAPNLEQMKGIFSAKPADSSVALLGNVLAYFCNVRAKNYIISASHDRHSNPHISTILGIITRAVTFPEDEPVCIYLTNPTPKLVWQKILLYWFQVSRIERSTAAQSSHNYHHYDPKLFGKFDMKEFAKMLQIMEKEQNNGEWRDPWEDRGISWRAMIYGPDNPYFQFYVLRPGLSHGTIIGGPTLGNDLHDASERMKYMISGLGWDAITPYDDCTNAFLVKNYHKDFHGLGEQTSLPTRPTLMKRIVKDNVASYKEILMPEGPYGTPNHDPNEFMSDLYFVIKMSQGKLKDPSIISGQDDLLKHMPMVAETPPPETVLEEPSLESNEETENSNRGKANHAVFRRFDIDDFDIPKGDEPSTMLGKKMKHLNTLAALLNYFVDSGKMERNDAVRASITGSINGYPTLSALAYLLFGIEGADAFLKTLPLNFLRDPKLLQGPVQNSLQWPAQLLDVAVLDMEILEQKLQNGSGIQQVNMRIFPPAGQKYCWWVVPNHSSGIGNGRFTIQIQECIDVTIYWPTETKRRIIHGKFLGKLPAKLKTPEQPITCQWLVMPNSQGSVVYHINFSDQGYNTEGVEMNILDMMKTFDSVPINLALALADIPLPGLPKIDADKPLGDNIKFSDSGFTLRRDFYNSRDLRLHSVFGRFSLVNIPDWRPFDKFEGRSGLEGFLGKISIPTPSVRLAIENIFSESEIKAFFRINHSIKIGNSNLAYEVQTRPAPHGGRLTEFTFRPMNLDANTPLTINELLATFGLAPAKQDIPQFLTDALSSISLTSFRFGWNKDLSLRVPDYMEVLIRIEKLPVAGGFLVIDDVSIRLRIDGVGRKETRNVYLQSDGIFHLVDLEHLASFSYGQHYALLGGSGHMQGQTGPMDLAIHCMNTPLTLDAILGHFWPGKKIFPEPFSSVTKEVGLSEMVLEMRHSESLNKQVVQTIKIGLGVSSSEIEILEGLSLIEPSLDITALYPFEQDLRTFIVNFSSMIMIDNHSLLVNVGFIAGKSSSFRVSLRAGGEGYPVGAFLSFLSRKIGKTFKVLYPDIFGPLDTTYINDFSLVIGNGGGNKLVIQSFHTSVWSDLQLDLWTEPAVILQKVTLDAGYNSTAGFDFTFGAQLRIDEHVLLTTVGYGPLPYGGLSNGTSDRNESKDTSGWVVNATYQGDIDLIAVVRKLTMMDLVSELSTRNVRNAKPKQDTGIVIKNLSFTLQKSKSGGAIHISAETDWAVFKHIDFAATFYSTSSWGFSLTMMLKDDLLSLIPIEFIKDFSKYVEVSDTNVAIYAGRVQPQQAGPVQKRTPPKPGSRSLGSFSNLDFGLAVSTKLKMTDRLGILKRWIGDGDLEIEGYVSTRNVGLSAKAPSKIRLCHNEETDEYAIEVSGRLGVNAGPGFEISLTADMDIRCPFATKDIIKLRNTGFALNSLGGVGFQGEIDGTLSDIFGIEGLDVRGLSIKALFSVVEEGLPEELMVTGGLTLKGAGDFNSHIALYYAQHSLTNCFFSGKLEKLDMQAFVNCMLRKQRLPEIAQEFLKGNVVINNLELEAALEDIHVRQLKRDVQQGFFYEASLYIHASDFKWSGYTCIEFRKDALQFVGMMSPISFSNNTSTFFNISRGSLIPADYISDMPNSNSLDENMLKSGPVIYITSKNTATPLLMSAQLTLFGFKAIVEAKGDSNGFHFLVDTSIVIDALGSASVKAAAAIKPKEKVSGHLLLGIDVHLNLPSIELSAFGQSVTLPSTNLSLVEFHVSLGVAVGWPNTGTGFKLDFNYRVRVLEEEFNLSVSLNLSPEDLDSLGKVMQQVIQDFRDEFRDIMVNRLGGKEVQQAITFMKDKFNQTGKELVLAATILSHIKPENIISKFGLEALSLNNNAEVIGVLNNFYSSNPGKVQNLAARLLGIPFGGSTLRRPDVEEPRMPNMPDFRNDPDFPDLLELPKILDGSAVHDLPVIPGGPMPDYPDPIDAGSSDKPIDPDFYEIPDVPVGWGITTSSHAVLEEATAQSLAPQGLTSLVLITTTDSTGTIPVIASVPTDKVLVARQWTQGQVNEYVRVQRLDFLKASLEFFTPDQVLDSATIIFSDLSKLELQGYLAKAVAGT